MKEEQTDKIGAIVKLGLWLIFIAVLMIIARFGGTDNTESNLEDNGTEIKEEIKDKDEITYENKLNKLLNNYKYAYEIKIGNDIFKFEGSKMDKNNFVNESGTLNLNGAFKFNYFLENGYSYLVNNGGLDKVDSIYDSRIDINNLDLVKIKDNLITKEYKLEDDRYIYELEDRNVIVYSEEENIDKIEIYIKEDYYKLDIESIGEIKEITY